jgi:hypothetical protein
LSKQILTNKWKWGVHPFNNPLEIGHSLKSSFDEQVSPIDIQTGVVGDSLLLLSTSDDSVILKSGEYSIGGDVLSLFPSESIHEIIKENNQPLIDVPGNKMLPILAIYKRDESGNVTISSKYRYTIASDNKIGIDSHPVLNPINTVLKKEVF